MIVDEVETELGGVQLFSNITERDTKLAIVLGVDIRTDTGDLDIPVRVNRTSPLKSSNTGGA